MENWKKVITCLKELDMENPRLNSFQSKLIVQKTVYLLKAMGIDIEYPFNFHVRGTYSPQLANDMYKHRQEFEHLSSGEKLPDKDRELLEKFKKDAGPSPDPAILEIAAAYAFFFKQSNEPRKAMLKTKEAKSFFSESQFVQGINLAKELVYKPTPEELKRLKEEFKRWEQA